MEITIMGVKITKMAIMRMTLTGMAIMVLLLVWP